MIWQALSRWVIAGCLSAAALNISAAPRETVISPEEKQPSVLETIRDPSLKPVEAAPSSEGTLTPVPVEGKIQLSPEGGTSPLVSESEDYKVQPEDVLQITVYEEPDLTTKVRVASSGEINFPLLRRITVAGLSIMEVQEKITQLLAEDYLVNPQVQVFIETYHARDVFVTGAVNKPGSYPLPAGKPTTLMEAVTMAGGFSEEAAINSTRIIRIDAGRETTLNVKAGDIIKKGDKAKDVEVRPNDVIFVPESFF
jgi:polysaccharide export outer membrane protein